MSVSGTTRPARSGPRAMTGMLANLAARYVPQAPPGRRRFSAAPPHALRAHIGVNRFGTYCVPISASHRPAARAVLSGRVYEPETIDYLVGNCGERDVVTAGTFFGDFLPALHAGIGADAKIWAFEPNGESYRCAEVTCLLNGLDRVELRRAALGESTSTAEIVTHDKGGRALGGGSRIVAGGGDAVVDVLDLDSLIPTDRDVGIIQLDVEGYELAAMKGAMATVERCRPKLVLETVPEDAWLNDTLLELGYRRVRNVHFNTVFETAIVPEH